jgi:hypothetical protein
MREKVFTGLFTGALTRSRPFLMVLCEGKTNLRSECSFVPNQALYQAEPQPEFDRQSGTPRRRASLFRLFCDTWQEAIAVDAGPKSVVPKKSNRKIVGRFCETPSLLRMRSERCRACR